MEPKSKEHDKGKGTQRTRRLASTLSQGQLSRKREKDREAQRLLRQRNKNYIGTLERKVLELSVNEELRKELASVRRDNQRLQDELALLNAKIASSAGVPIQNYVLPQRPHLPEQNIENRASESLPERQIHAPQSNQLYHGRLSSWDAESDETAPEILQMSHGQPIALSEGTIAIDRSERYHGNLRIEHPVPLEDSSATSSNQGYYGNLANVAEFGDDLAILNRAGVYYGGGNAAFKVAPIEEVGPTNNSYGYYGNPDLVPFESLGQSEDSRAYFGNHGIQALLPEEDPSDDNQIILNDSCTDQQAPALFNNDYDQSITSVVVDRHGQYNSFSIRQRRFNPSMANTYIRQPSPTFWDLPVCISTPQGIVEDLLISVIRDCRKQADNLANCRTATMGNAFYIRQLPRGVATDPISETAAKILETLSIMRTPERAAALYFIHRLCCYLVYPTREYYDRLPSWYVPLASQMTGRHPLWGSFVIFPGLRDRIIAQPHLYATSEFLEAFGLNINVSWPYGDDKVFMVKNKEILINPAYEAHIRRLDSWSLDAGFARRYPELQGYCNFSGIDRPRFEEF